MRWSAASPRSNAAAEGFRRAHRRLTAAAALTIWGLDGIARSDPWWSILARLVVGGALSVWFARRQLHLPQPMIALDLFRLPRFRLAGLSSAASFTALGLAFVSLPFYFQVTLGHTPLESGLLLTSWPLAVACIAPLAGRLSDRVSVPLLATSGLAILTLGLALYAMRPPHPSPAQIVLHGVVCKIGFGWFQSPNNRELLGSAPREKSTSASGLLATFRVGGQTLGASIVALIFGIYGARIGGIAPQTAVAHAIPAVLWVACGCAAAATIASGLRMRASARGK